MNPSSTALSTQPKIKQDSEYPRRSLPIGAEFVEHRQTHFRVWAPESKTVCVVLSDEPELKTPVAQPLHREPGGYFAGILSNTNAGLYYRYRLEAGDFPAPVSLGIIGSQTGGAMP